MISRRALLGASAAATLPVVVTAAPVIDAEVVPAEPQEKPELINAWHEFRAAEEEFQAADSEDAKDAAANAMLATLTALVKIEPATLYGVRLKADAVAYYYEYLGVTAQAAAGMGILGLSYWLACDVTVHTEHMRGRWKVSG